jgi:hypothetical protein
MPKFKVGDIIAADSNIKEYYSSPLVLEDAAKGLLILNIFNKHNILRYKLGYRDGTPVRREGLNFDFWELAVHETDECFVLVSNNNHNQKLTPRLDLCLI